jgi:hypothetical protein
MLASYGVVVGEYTSYITEQGQWFHVDLTINAGGTPYQAAADVNEVNGQFQFQVLNNLDPSLFAAITGLADGWHTLASNATSGAMDYARSPILQKALGSQPWTNVTGNEAGEALIAMVTGSAKVFAFGEPYTGGGNGVHNVHCNQGDPPGPHQSDDGIWQDGCVLARKADGSISAYLGKFSTQTLNTNNNGLPIAA